MYSEIELKKFYRRESIAVDAFDCPNKHKCKEAASPRLLYHGAEAHVGSKYGEVLRIVVIALDTGHRPENLEQRRVTIESQWGGGLNKHMQGTTEITQELLKGRIADGTSPHPYYAMINAAKCSGADGKRDMVPDELYAHCRPFALKEIELLNPQLLVTQGKKAAAVLSAPQIPIEELITIVGGITEDREIQQWLISFGRQYLRAYSLEEDNYVPVLEVPHPSSRNGSWTLFKNIALAPVLSLIKGLTEMRVTS